MLDTNQMAKLSTKIEALKNSGMLYYENAIIGYVNMWGNLDSSIFQEHYESIMEYSELIDSLSGQTISCDEKYIYALLHMLRGNAYMICKIYGRYDYIFSFHESISLDKFEKAISDYSKCIETLEFLEISGYHNSILIELAFAYFSRAKAKKNFNRHDETLQDLRITTDLFKKVSKKEGFKFYVYLVNAYMSMGVVYSCSLNDYQKGLEMDIIALELCKQAPQNDSITNAAALLSQNIAFGYKELKNYDAAIIHYTEAIRLLIQYTSLADKKSLADVYSYRAEVYETTDNSELATADYINSINVNIPLFKEEHALTDYEREKFAKTYEKLSDLYFAENDYVSSIECLKCSLDILGNDILYYPFVMDGNRPGVYHSQELYCNMVIKAALIAREHLDSECINELKLKYLTHIKKNAASDSSREKISEAEELLDGITWGRILASAKDKIPDDIEAAKSIYNRLTNYNNKNWKAWYGLAECALYEGKKPSIFDRKTVSNPDKNTNITDSINKGNDFTYGVYRGNYKERHLEYVISTDKECVKAFENAIEYCKDDTSYA